LHPAPAYFEAKFSKILMSCQESIAFLIEKGMDCVILRRKFSFWSQILELSLQEFPILGDYYRRHGHPLQPFQ
jgi:hypothetical protein